MDALPYRGPVPGSSRVVTPCPPCPVGPLHTMDVSVALLGVGIRPSPELPSASNEPDKIIFPSAPPHVPRGQAAVCESQLEPSPSHSWDCPQKPSCVLGLTALSDSSGADRTSSFPAQLGFLREQGHTLPVYHLLPTVSFREMVPFLPFPPQNNAFPQPSLLFVGFFFKSKSIGIKGHSGTEERVLANSQGLQKLGKMQKYLGILL